MKRTKMDIPTGIKLPRQCYVNAHITGPKEGTEGEYSVRWQIVSQSKHQIRECAIRPRTHYFNPKTETWEDAKSVLVARAVEAYRKESSAALPLSAPGEEGGSASPYSDALANLTESELRTLRSRNWGEPTWRQHLGYLKRICAELDRQNAAEHADESGVTLGVLCTVREALIKEVEKNKRTKNGQTAAATVDKELRATRRCLNLLVEMVNECEGRIVLPQAELIRVCDLRAATSDYEQAKWIPLRVLVRMVAICFMVIGNGLVLGVVLMLCLGLRSNEACAVRFCDLISIGEGYLYPVRKQGAVLNKLLKTENAYRDVYGGKLLWDLVCARIHYLMKMGYSIEATLKMHVVSKPGSPTEPVDGDALSDYARKILYAAGYTHEDYLRATQLMSLEPEFEADGKTPITSPSAYIFRRNAATLLVAVSDLYPCSNAIDEYLGHKSHYPRIADYTNDTLLKDFSIPSLERIVLSPAHTDNPLYRPITLQKGTTDYTGFSGYQIVASEDMDIEVELESTEPNQYIEFYTNADVTMRDVCRERGHSSFPGQCAVRPVIPLPLSQEEFEDYLRDIDKVDLSGLLPPPQDTSKKT